MITQIKNGDNMAVFSPRKQLLQCVYFYKILTPQNIVFSNNYTLIPNSNTTIYINFDGNKIVANVWGTSKFLQNIGSEPSNYQCLLLIELLPFGLYQLTGFNQTEFIDQRIDLKDVSIKLNQYLCNAFESANTEYELAQQLDFIFLDLLGKYILSDELLYVATRISNNNGNIFMKDLTDYTNYSLRHLNRVFNKQIGTNIKTFSSLTRLNYTLKQLKFKSSTLADIAVQCGYYDQSHFTQDFRNYCGTTPSLYLKSMSDFSYTAR